MYALPPYYWPTYRDTFLARSVCWPTVAAVGAEASTARACLRQPALSLKPVQKDPNPYWKRWQNAVLTLDQLIGSSKSMMLNGAL